MSASAATSFAVWFASQGWRTTLDVDGPKRGDVLEPHLRRPVLADRDAGVRAAQHEGRPAHGCHADEVVRARQERGEGGGERPPADGLQPHGGRDHLLLGDVHLEEALRMGLREDLGEGRVGDLAVEDDHVAAGGAERRERVTVGLARRDLAPDLVARQLERSGREPVRLSRLGLRDLDPEIAQAAELRDRRVRVVERLAVPAVLVLDGLHALALDGACDDDRRLARSVATASA